MTQKNVIGQKFCQLQVQLQCWFTINVPKPTEQVFLKFSVWLCEFFSSKFELVPEVVCFCVCSVEYGGVGNYIDICGGNTVWHQLQVPSCWLLFWNYRHNQCVLDDLISCAQSIHPHEKVGDLCVHTECEISRLLDFISALKANRGSCLDKG